MSTSTRKEGGGLSADRRELLARLMADAGLTAAPDTTITRRDHAATAPLSFAQEVLWLLDRATPALTAYNSAIARRIHGQLDVAALARALGALVARHETLRTVFQAHDDSAVQAILPPPAVVLERHDVRDTSVVDRSAAALRLVQDIASTPFSLATSPAFRAALVQVDDNEYILVLLTHHIVSDAWSYSVMFDELNASYDAYVRGVAPSLPEPALQYGDFTAWQRQTLQGEQLEERLAYWRKQLADLPTLELPTDRREPSAPHFGGARVATTLPVSFANELKALATRHDATLYMVLLAALQTVLHRYANQDDIVVGSAVAGRTRRETERLIGYFSQALPMRTRFDGDPTFAQLLARVSETVLGAFDHQDVPIETVVLELQRAKARSAPLFRVVLTMQDALTSELRFGDATVTAVDVDLDATKFDLTLLVSDGADGLGLSLWYRTALFERATAERLLAHLQLTLRSVVRDPSVPVSTLPMLTEGEHDAIRQWNATAVDVGPRTTMLALIADTVTRFPDAVAVTDGADTLVYSALWACAGTVATQLRDAGVGANDCVGLALDRSVAAIAGMIGIWRAGAAYVPLSPEWPETRRAQVLTASGARTMVVAGADPINIPDGVRSIPIDIHRDQVAAMDSPFADVVPEGLTPESLAYVLYTSGSTGEPKGVAVTHANVVHYTRSISRVLGDIPSQASGDGLSKLREWHFALASSLTADLGNTVVFPSLAAGATLHVLGHAVTTEPDRYAEYLRRHRIDVLKLTPNHLNALLAGARDGDLGNVLPARWLVLGGELLHASFARRVLRADTCRVLNHYGPTEATVGACTFEVTAAAVDAIDATGWDAVPVGFPIANMRASVIDGNGNEQPVGVAGELVLTGDGIAIGYLGRADLTAERFGADIVRGDRKTGTDSAARGYRTGDRVRRRADGAIEFLGRVDDQIKIRGYRVELGEIQAVINQYAGVAHSIVLAREDGAGESRVVAYVVPTRAGYAASHAERLTASTLGQWIESQLPSYMVPSSIVLLEQLPLTPNGKVDRRALPDPELPTADAHVSVRIAPRSDTEIAIAAIWSDVLKRDDIGVKDNFLELGGHSLLAIRVLGKISKSCGVRLPLRTLFEAPTVEQLAIAVDQAIGNIANAGN